MTTKTIAIVGQPEHAVALTPLLHAYGLKGYSCQWIQDEKFSQVAACVESIPGLQAVLVLHQGASSPARVVPAPYLRLHNGDVIPVGVLCFRRVEMLSRFSQTAAAVHLRKSNRYALAILSQRHPRYIRVADRMAEILGPVHNRQVFSWTADRLLPEQMIAGCQTGVGAVLYVGHGRPIGWVGYYGIRIRHFANPGHQPMGAVISLCCHTANRRRVGYSFSEELVLQGFSAASVGAVCATLHTDNTRWAVNLSQAMTNTPETIGSLIVNALPAGEKAVRSYRIIGDPLAPLCSTQATVKAAKKLVVCH